VIQAPLDSIDHGLGGHKPTARTPAQTFGADGISSTCAQQPGVRGSCPHNL